MKMKQKEIQKNDYITHLDGENIYMNFKTCYDFDKRTASFLKEYLEIYKDETINILDIGCGNGDILLETLKELDLQKKHFNIFFNDSSHEMIEELQNNIIKKFTNINNKYCFYFNDNSFEDIICDFNKNDTWGIIYKNCKQNIQDIHEMKFHMILLSHSFYSFLERDIKNKKEEFSDSVKVLKFIWNRLDKSGICLIVASSGKSPEKTIKFQLDDFKDANAEKILELIIQQAYPFKYHSDVSKLDIQELINNSELTEKGIEWASYYFRTDLRNRHCDKKLIDLKKLFLQYSDTKQIPTNIIYIQIYKDIQKRFSLGNSVADNLINFYINDYTKMDFKTTIENIIVSYLKTYTNLFEFINSAYFLVLDEKHRYEDIFFHVRDEDENENYQKRIYSIFLFNMFSRKLFAGTNDLYTKSIAEILFKGSNKDKRSFVFTSVDNPKLNTNFQVVSNMKELWRKKVDGFSKVVNKLNLSDYYKTNKIKFSQQYESINESNKSIFKELSNKFNDCYLSNFNNNNNNDHLKDSFYKFKNCFTEKIDFSFDDFLRYHRVIGHIAESNFLYIFFVPSKHLTYQKSSVAGLYFIIEVSSEEIEEIIEFFVHVFVEDFHKIATIINQDHNTKLILNKSLKAAVSAIMSRNGSHNIGSHVINRVVENIDTLNIQDHKYFLRYLQQRMDFIAQISTEFPKWSTSHWFVMEIMKNFYSQKHLLNYIVESEGLKAYEEGSRRDTNTDKLQCVIKNIKKYNLKSINDEHSYRESYCEFSSNEMIDCKYKEKGQVLVCDRDLCKADPNGDIKVAVPGGMVGFHALYTIIENFLRNSAKHNYARYPDAEKENRKEPMLITFKIWNYEDVHDYYTVRIRDNYSYISGLIAESTFNEESDKDFDKKKMRILHPVAKVVKDIKSCLKEKDNIKFDLANHKNIASDNYDIIFIIDDGKVFRENGIKLGYCDLMLDSRVRFIEEAYWNDFLRNTKPSPISVDEQIRFLKQYYIPVHLKINNKIINSLIEDNGSLRKADWGIAEMKISAGFLYKKDISQIGGGGEENLDNLIKAIAIPEYRDGKIRAYRLGYEFRMLKPVDVLLIGYSGDDNEALKREAILPVDKYDKIQYSAEMAVVLDDKKNNDNDLLLLLKSAEDNTDKIKTGIEDYPGRLFVVSDDKNIESKIGRGKFLKKRIILIQQEEFNEISKSESGSYTSFKNKLLKHWISHVMKLRGKEELNIVINPTEGGTVGTKDINPEELLDAFLFLKSAIAQKNSKRLIEKKEVYEEILNRMLSGNIENRAKLKECLKEEYNINGDEIEKLDVSKINEIKEKTRPFIKRIFEDYGIFQSESYTPSTLPEIFKENFKEKSITGEGVFFKLNSKKVFFEKIFFYNKAHEASEKKNKIIYERHREVVKKDGFIYQENLGGGSMHFHLFAYPKDWIEEFGANIIENGLLKIAIMDERVAGSSILKTYHPELEAAGIYFIKEFLGFKLDYEWSDDSFITIDDRGIKSVKNKEAPDIDILIIHQGLLDKMDNIDKETIAERFRQLKEFIPYIFVTSGRGRPDTISEGVKYVPFGIIESTLLQKPHSKLLLTKQLLGGISD